MKRILICAVCLSFVLFSCKQTVPMTLDISGDWKFSTGDEKAWLSPDFNDSLWHSIKAGKHYEKQGFDKYDGISCYRKMVFISDSMKNAVDSKYQSLLLILGCIDDVDQVYFNGTLIGSTGVFDTPDGTSYAMLRKYLIPENLIRWNDENLIAIRMNDFSGNGGLYKGPFRISDVNIKDMLSVKSDIATINGIFAKGEKASFSIHVKNFSRYAVNGKLHYIVSHDTHEEISRHEVPLKIHSEDSTLLAFEYPVSDPGFYQINFIGVQDNDTLLSDSIWFGYDPAAIQSGTSKPADFDAFWTKAKEELKTIAPRFKTTLSAEHSTALINVYEVEMYSIGNARVRGWYSLPKSLKKGTKLPALLRHIGYSGNNTPIIDRPEFAALSFNIRGHGNSIDDVNPGFPQFLTNNLTDKDNYIYRGAYMDCIRAVDFLCSRSEVDTARIAVYGGSQGGALSIATAALDSRIDLCAPHIPFLSDFRKYFKIVTFPGSFINEKMKADPSITWDAVYQTLDYFDVRNLAPWITVPVYMGVGLRDRTCPPYINFAVFNNTRSSEKHWFVFKEYSHSVPDTQHLAEYKWFKNKFGVE